MTKMASKTTDNIDKLCSLCSETIQFFAVGQCDHPVCFKCSTRMRVLFEQQYCAICRSDMPKVLFMRRAHKFDSVSTHQFLQHRSAGLYFESAAIKTTFHALLEHRCTACANSGTTFRSFAALQEHLRREHSRFYCELCMKHLMLFSWERRFYDRRKLAEHRRVGDADNRSHRGHPRCEFCDERYFDNDELVRHLRKDHYYCHFCDADGISNLFFGDYAVLQEHFSEQHYLCTEGECIGVQFTNAFRTDIDLAAHRATEHLRGVRKAHAKQARTIDIDINLVPRRVNARNHMRNRGVVTSADYTDVVDNPHRRRHLKNAAPTHAPPPTDNATPQQPPSAELNRLSGMRLQRTGPNPGGQQRSNQSARLDDFPELRGGGLGSGHSGGAPPGMSAANTVAMASNRSVRHAAGHVDDFPSLGGATAPPVQPAQAKIWQKLTDKQKSSQPAKVESSNRCPESTMQTLARGPTSLSSIGNSLFASRPASANETKPGKNKAHNTDKTADNKPGIVGGKHARNADVKLSSDKVKMAANTATKRLKNYTNPAKSDDSHASNRAKSAIAQNAENTSEKTATISDKRERATEKITSNADVKASSSSECEKASIRTITTESNGWTAAEQTRDVEPNGKAEKIKNTEEEDWPTLCCTKSETSVVDEPFTVVNGSKSGTKWKAVELANKPGKAYLLDEDGAKDGESPLIVNAKMKAKRKKKEENVNGAVVVNNDTMHEGDEEDSASIVRLLANSTPEPVEPPPASVSKIPSAPPPGFQKMAAVKAPPPGFEKPASSVAVPPVASEFIRPVDFQQRNQRLISDFRTVLTHDDQFVAFATASREFRHGIINAKTYYTRCESLLGATSLKLLLPELLVLLPDIQRQGELLAVIPSSKTSGRRGQRQGVSRPQPQSPFIVCHICEQVLRVGERNTHVAMHDTHADFPELGS